MPAATRMDQHDAPVAADEPVAHSETTEGSGSNPRKRKKSSRACDFCHVNHQPCDNAKPRCSYCERHGKSCLYLRPQKKRGPAQGYRSALHSMRESAAAWGAVLNLIPSLGPVIEGYLQKEEGQHLVRAIRDPQQQEFFIQAWQQSAVFKAFFGDDGTPEAAPAAIGGAGGGGEAGAGTDLDAAAAAAAAADSAVVGVLPPPPPLPPQQPQHYPHQPLTIPTTAAAAADERARLGLLPMSVPPPETPPGPVPHAGHALSFPAHDLLSMPFDPQLESMLQQQQQEQQQREQLQEQYQQQQQQQHHHHQQQQQQQPPFSQPISDDAPSQADDLQLFGGGHLSLSDIVARDAARSSDGYSQMLGSLGFAPGETLNDFLAISYNPDPVDTAADDDALLGSELDQKAYYELLMGRQFT